MDSTEICFMPVAEMAASLKAKRLSPVEVMEAVLSRIERLNPRLNAYCTLVAESALEQAKEAEDKIMRGEKLGPLHGIPLAVKDTAFTKGIRTTSGSRFYADFIPGEDAISIKRLKTAGAIVIGKTNAPELAWTAVTTNQLFGTTRNPWDLERTPGGSSGGSAAAVASGMAPLASAGDGGGSTRIPASFCGIYGLKPSFGRIPEGPGFPGWEIFSHSGVLTRTVKDTALVLEIIAGRDDRYFFTLPETNLRYLDNLDGDLKGLRVAWSKDLGYATVDPRVTELAEKAARKFETLGAIVEEANPDAPSPARSFSILYVAMMLGPLEEMIAKHRDLVEPELVRMYDDFKGIPALERERAWRECLNYWQAIYPFFEKYDFLLTPTAATLPFETGRFYPEEIAGVKISGVLGVISLTYPFNMTRQPAASIPCGWTDDGLPVGLQIVGRRFDDAGVLKASAAFEKVSPWIDKRPALD